MHLSFTGELTTVAVNPCKADRGPFVAIAITESSSWAAAASSVVEEPYLATSSQVVASSSAATASSSVAATSVTHTDCTASAVASFIIFMI